MIRREHLLPWSGFILGAIGWVVSQQWGSARVNDGCLTAWNWQTLLIGIGGLIVVAIGAMLSWRARQDYVIPTTRFIATVSLCADGVFTLAILFHSFSALVIPRCFS